MTKKLTKDTLFKPAPSRRETKSDITDRTVRAILADEAARSRAKTAKLRAARMKLEAGRHGDQPMKTSVPNNKESLCT